jgi:hypothetical protein
MQLCKSSWGVVLGLLATSLLSVDAQPLVAAKGFLIISENQTLKMPETIGRRLEAKIGTLGKCPTAQEWAGCKQNAACLDAVSIKGNQDGVVKDKTAFTGADADAAETKGLHEGFDKVIAQVDGDKGMVGNIGHDLFNDPMEMKNAGFQAACNAVPGLMHKSLDQAVQRFMLGILLGVGGIVFVTGSLGMAAYKSGKDIDAKQIAMAAGGWCCAVILGLALPFVLTGTPESIKEKAVCSITTQVCEAVKSACAICWAKDPCKDPCGNN